MNPARVHAEDYIHFLLATPKTYSALEAGRVQPPGPNAAAHDAFTRLLNRLEPEPARLWIDVAPHVRKSDGALVLDDATLDKPYARHMGLVGPHWSGKHRRVVQGINLLTLLWTDGDVLWPCDYRLRDPSDKKKTKNDLFRELLAEAKARGFNPPMVAFDSWYSGLENLKAVRGYGWSFLTQLPSNRLVNPDGKGNKPISECEISASGTVVHLKGFGMVKVFRIALTKGGTEHWVTNDLGMDEMTRVKWAEHAWGIEEYHRGLKQHTGVERCQHRQSKAQRNHIGFAIRAFVRLEWQRFKHGISWFESVMRIIRPAITAYISNPSLLLPIPPTA